MAATDPTPITPEAMPDGSCTCEECRRIAAFAGVWPLPHFPRSDWGWKWDDELRLRRERRY